MTTEPATRKHRSWWKKTNALELRNGETLLILSAAIIVGVAVTFITALMGVR
ncbi:MAG: hypothetical protein ABR507_00440 [Actinomycetota bacterium]|nr:hypothetical protein [Actinomycetota bacterium]